MKTRIALIGGFLGAGKTTLLWKMAEKLSEQGNIVGLITNDQASELVDTAFLTKAGGVTTEVSGSCFCCNFNGFADAIGMMKQEHKVDIIIAEPVGSCTDLSATIMQPLKDKWKEELIISPLNVLVDPVRLAAILNGENSGLHSSAAYIVEKQLEEADYIVINKMDLLSQEEAAALKERTIRKWSQAKVYTISGQTGEGLEDWMRDALSNTDAGTHLAEIDYDVYAEGEAVLGWLNTDIKLESSSVDWNVFTENLLKALGDRFDSIGAAVGHVKLMLEDDNEYILGNITGKRNTMKIRGVVDQKEIVKLTLNARVEMNPQNLQKLVMEVLEQTCKDEVKYTIQVIKCLQPGRPNPTYRYDTVVNYN